MAKKKVIPAKGHAYEKSFDFLPFKLITLYSEGESIPQIVETFHTTYPELTLLLAADDVGSKTTSAMVYKANDSTSVCLFIKKGISISILIHECVHIVSRIFDIIGSEVNEETEEFFAYLQEYIFKEVYTLITKQLKLKMEL
jgi:hypothetical protein